MKARDSITLRPRYRCKGERTDAIASLDVIAKREIHDPARNWTRVVQLAKHILWLQREPTTEIHSAYDETVNKQLVTFSTHDTCYVPASACCVHTNIATSLIRTHCCRKHSIWPGVLPGHNHSGQGQHLWRIRKQTTISSEVSSS
jgi:hypothetical protein